MSYIFGNGLIKCLQCGGKYRGKKIREHKSYTCTTYQKLGKNACTNFMIKEEEIVHIASTHITLNGKSVEKPLEEYIRVVEVLDKGYTIIYMDGSKSVVNDNQSPYGTKFKY